MKWPSKKTEEQGDLVAEVENLRNRVAELEARFVNKSTRSGESIQKVETFNGEEEPESRESAMQMKYHEKIQSMKNAIKILPPNLIVDGRHVVKNVEAICGFKVSDEMMDEAYKDFTHEAFT